MDQTAAKEAVENVQEAVPKLKDVILELKDATLKGVVSLNNELGHKHMVACLR